MLQEKIASFKNWSTYGDWWGKNEGGGGLINKALTLCVCVYVC